MDELDGALLVDELIDVTWLRERLRPKGIASMMEVNNEQMMAAIVSVIDEELDNFEDMCIDQHLSIDPEKVKKVRAVEGDRMLKHKVVTECPEDQEILPLQLLLKEIMEVMV